MLFGHVVKDKYPKIFNGAKDLFIKFLAMLQMSSLWNLSGIIYRYFFAGKHRELRSYVVPGAASEDLAN